MSWNEYIFQGHGPDKINVCKLQSGCLFGELAILYNCRRTATIISTATVTLWSLERTIFQTVVKSAGKNKDQERYETIASVKDIKHLSEEKLRKIADCLEEETFENNQCIIKQVKYEICSIQRGAAYSCTRIVGT